jgi:hypothetical protein
LCFESAQNSPIATNNPPEQNMSKQIQEAHKLAKHLQEMAEVWAQCYSKDDGVMLQARWSANQARAAWAAYDALRAA